MKTVLAWIFVFFISNHTNAQSPEAISIHFDKDIYLPGEKIWFKAYVYNGTGLSELSTNFYIGLYDEHGRLIRDKQFPLIEGSTNGDFEVPDTIRSNRLQIVAFTKLTQSPLDHYKRELRIYRKGQSLLKSDQIPGVPFLKIFPEGGHLVNQLINYVTISSEFSNGKPFQTRGAIVESSSNKLVDSFYTDENGLAKFQFIPSANSTYKAIWINPSGSAEQTVISGPDDKHVTLHAEIANRKVHYIINRKPLDPVPAALEKLELQIITATDTFYQARINMNKLNKVISSIPVDSFPSGLYLLRLTDSDRKILQEKNFHIPESSSEIKIVQKEISSSAKGKNIIEIYLPNSSIYNLSLSIAENSFYIDGLTSSIHEELLLSRRVSFNGSREALFASSPSLMDMLGNALRTRVYGSPGTLRDRYISFNIISNSARGVTDKDQLNVLVKDQVSGPSFYSAGKLSSNSYQLANMIFYDSSGIYYKVNSNDELSRTLSFTRTDSIGFNKKIDPLPQYNSLYVNSAVQADPGLLQVFDEKKPTRFNEVQTIQNVVVKSRYVNPESKRIQELDDQYSTGMFKGITRGYQLNVVDDEKAWAHSDVLTYVANKIPSIRVISSGMQRQLYVMSRDSFKPVLLLTFLDEVELPEQEGLENVQMKDVAYIKFTPGIVIGSSFRTSEGVIFVYTRRGKDLQSSIPGMYRRAARGYSLASDFVLPDYTNKSQLVNPDYRTTLYWNPYLVTDQPKGRKITIEYYNNDITKKALLRLQGINSTGQLIYVEKLLGNGD